ncbi:cytochrome P450 [Kibdelosporangium lantanae]
MIRTTTPKGDPVWVANGHAEVRDLLQDERLGRSHRTPETAARLGESALFGGPQGDFDTELVDHARMRALLQPHFSAKHMRALGPRVAALTTELLDGFTPPTDLVAGLAVPLPILVICELLGVPYAERDQFRAWSEDAGNTVDRQRSEQGMAALFGYGYELVARKRAEPADDVISRLAATDGVTDDEVATLAMALLFAGHETTVAQIGVAALQLLSDPDRWAKLCADPGLVPNAVEESLRTPVRENPEISGLIRYARTDMHTDTADVPAGGLVVLDVAKANLDPAVFPHADRFDVTRSTNPHLSFGHGIRYCLGAPLARVELREVFTQLVTRFPGMRLAVPAEEVRQKSEQLTAGLVELPVTW